MSSMSEKIRMFRGILAMDPKDFWQKCGIFESYEDYDKGKLTPPYDALAAMESMGLNLNFLFNDQEPMMKKDLENLVNVVSEGISQDDSVRIDKLVKILETQISSNINALEMLKDITRK